MDDIFLIIDGYNIIYRAFFALLNSNGKTTSVSVFFASLLNLLKTTQANHLAVCMDSRGPTLRKQAYAEYKANREKTPPKLHEETDLIRSILSSFNIPVLSQAGYEADDLICSLQRKYKGKATIYIASGDKDLLQLVNASSKVFQLRCDAKEERWTTYDDDKVIEKYGIPPIKMASYLALLGDASDNVPGVAGVGDKSARELLASYENIDDIYARLESVKPAIRKKLEAGKDDAFASFELVSLDNEKYLYDLQDDVFDNYSIEKANAISGTKALEDAGCIRIAGQIRKFMRDKGLFDEKEAQTAREKEKTEASAANECDCKEADIALASKAFNDSEKVSVLINESRTKAFFSANGTSSYKLNIKDPANLKAFCRMISDNASKIIALDAKGLYKLANECGNIAIKGLMDDVNVESYLLDSTKAQESIPSLARSHLGENLYRATKQTPTLFSDEDESDDPQDSSYAAAIMRIHSALAKKLESEKLCEVYSSIEKPLIPVISEMEQNGILINPEKIREINSRLGAEASELERKIYSLVGREFNIQSPKQLQDILTNVVKAPLTKKTQTGYSTDQQVLEELADDYEVISLILDYKAKTKLLQTYTTTLLEDVSPSDGRMHTTLLQTGTQTGRFSSVRPNLQNIPARTQEGNLIRGCFTASKGHKLISCDYSQIELRVLAHLSKDPNLCQFFNDDLDVHRATAAALKGADYNSDKITSKDRDSAKTINFAVIYGMSAFSLGKILKISNKEAQNFIDNYFGLFKGVVELKNRIIDEAKQTGYVMTEFGRKRFLSDITNPNKVIMQKAERQALNSTIQGEAADIMKIAILKTAKALESNGKKAKMLLTVHDEIIAEAKNDNVEDAKSIIKSEMENSAKLLVPLKTNASDGDNWGEL